MEHIRRATAADACRLAETEVFDYRLNFYPFFHTDAYFFGEMNVPALIGEYLREPERIDRTLVYDDGIVKGFIRVNGREIEKLFVEPVFQNMGIGSRLLETAVALTGADNLLALEKNKGAIRFYERHGFAATDERRRVDDTEEFFVVMRRG